MNEILQTERTVLRAFTKDDAPFIVQLLNSEGWLRYIGDRNIRNNEQAALYLENGPLKSYADNGFGLWKVTLKTTGEPIGMCGLIKRDLLQDPDLGFVFLPQYMGAGYGFEVAGATMNHAFDVLKLRRLAAITMPGNIPSVNLLRKLGFQYEKQLLSQNTELSLYFFDPQQYVSLDTGDS